MPALADLNIRPSYRKGEDDIAADFYLPCMGRAQYYDRAVGFFSSSIYLIAWTAISDFIARDGRMRLICSPLLSQADIDALSEGYRSRTDDAALSDLARQMLSNDQTRLPTRVLASLIRDRVLDVRIAVPTDRASFQRIFHDKVGIFRDEHGNKVVFKGSMNETWSGLAADGNIESIDAYVEWGGDRDARRVHDEVGYFEALWENRFPRCQVRPFPEAVRAELLQAVGTVDSKSLIDELLAPPAGEPSCVERRPLRLHQRHAIENWERRGRRGILEHATGSGKTETALVAISKSLDAAEVPLVLVPSELLLKQWFAALTGFFGDSLHVLVCGSGNSQWRQSRRLAVWTRPGRRRRLVLSTIQTAQTDLFRQLATDGKHIFLVADEVHRLGARESRSILAFETGPRLGLSATPRRAGDAEGTAAIMSYFEGIVPPPYMLRDAIRDGILTPYFYFVHTVILTDDEQSEWSALTREIGSIAARQQSQPDAGLANRIKQLLIKRARVCKTARGKLQVACDVLSAHFEQGQRWIVYCDNEGQLRDVAIGLRAAGHDPVVYYAAMEGDRAETLDYFISTGGIILAIRCLDEGVDIPSVSHALILASSTNPREFIQRRGRVLRRSPGKSFAVIHDVVVLPSEMLDDATGTRIVEGELARAVEFGLHAENPSAVFDLQRLAIRFGIDYPELVGQGVEDDE